MRGKTMHWIASAEGEAANSSMGIILKTSRLPSAGVAP